MGLGSVGAWVYVFRGCMSCVYVCVCVWWGVRMVCVYGCLCVCMCVCVLYVCGSMVCVSVWVRGCM